MSEDGIDITYTDEQKRPLVSAELFFQEIESEACRQAYDAQHGSHKKSWHTGAQGPAPQDPMPLGSIEDELPPQANGGQDVEQTCDPSLD